MRKESSMMPRGVSRGLAGLGQLSSFDLEEVDGERVRSWDYRGRRHLVIWLAGPAPEASELAEAARQEPALRAEGAELLVVVLGSAEQAGKLDRAGLRGPVLADPDGRLHERLVAPRPTLLVTDRNGTIFWRARLEEARAGFEEARSWLEYLNILEPECGTCVPAWPVDLFEGGGQS